MSSLALKQQSTPEAVLSQDMTGLWTIGAWHCDGIWRAKCSQA